MRKPENLPHELFRNDILVGNAQVIKSIYGTGVKYGDRYERYIRDTLYIGKFIYMARDRETIIAAMVGFYHSLDGRIEPVLFRSAIDRLMGLEIKDADIVSEGGIQALTWRNSENPCIMGELVELMKRVRGISGEEDNTTSRLSSIWEERIK